MVRFPPPSNGALMFNLTGAWIRARNERLSILERPIYTLFFSRFAPPFHSRVDLAPDDPPVGLDLLPPDTSGSPAPTTSSGRRSGQTHLAFGVPPFELAEANESIQRAHTDKPLFFTAVQEFRDRERKGMFARSGQYFPSGLVMNCC